MIEDFSTSSWALRPFPYEIVWWSVLDYSRISRLEFSGIMGRSNTEVLSRSCVSMARTLFQLFLFGILGVFFPKVSQETMKVSIKDPLLWKSEITLL